MTVTAAPSRFDPYSVAISSGAKPDAAPDAELTATSGVRRARTAGHEIGIAGIDRYDRRRNRGQRYGGEPAGQPRGSQNHIGRSIYERDGPGRSARARGGNRYAGVERQTVE